MGKAKDFVPQTVVFDDGGGWYGLMAVELTTCATCSKHMANAPPKYENAFPRCHLLRWDEQVKRAGWERNSYAQVNDSAGNGKPICATCATSGRASFTCAICKQVRTSGEVEESYGVSRPEFLCTSCFATVPAKAWEEKKRQLEGAHQWDDGQ